MATLGLESARPPFAQLGSSPSNQNHVGSANLPPNRGLERALEEAAASGVLNLSCRKLKEFPRTAANHDLSDTVEAELRAVVHSKQLEVRLQNRAVRDVFTEPDFGEA
ncbi:hypothetical protein CRENBAI_007505 [Crenichthys baileyi]|uniref:Uncharacterized protein n=1 Tax=Crenichthys baileyi TaxID=28760 RepID=A0AAV9QTR3_9TELE